MTKLFKNIRISTTIFLMGVVSLLFLCLIGVLGLMNIKFTNANMSLIYNHNLQPIAKIGAIRSNFLNMRLESLNTIITYSSSSESNVTRYISKTNDSIKSYEDHTIEGDEGKILENFKYHYGEYLKQWELIKEKLHNGQEVDVTDRSTLNSIGSLAEEKLSQLMTYNVDQAGQVYSVSDLTYSKTIKLMSIVFITCILIFFAISYFITANINKSAKDMMHAMETVAKGDFTLELDTITKNEFGTMKKSLSKIIKNISSMLMDIKTKSENIDIHSESLSAIAEEMASSSENAAAAITQVARGAGSQAEELITVTMTLNEFALKLENMVASINTIASDAKGVNSVANESSSNMQILIDSVNKVSSSFNGFAGVISGLSADINKINEITNFINSISDQTNLLALNAAIEAARAGEAGRGFSVVADEIRKLAEQSKISSQNINSLISGVLGNSSSIMKITEAMNKELINQVNIINTTIASFKKIIASVNAIIPQIQAASSDALSINDDKNTIVLKIEAASSIAEEVSASSEEVSASSEEISSSSGEVAASAQALSEMTKDMMEQVNKFKLN